MTLLSSRMKLSFCSKENSIQHIVTYKEPKVSHGQLDSRLHGKLEAHHDERIL